jgi:hypothetical protein
MFTAQEYGAIPLDDYVNTHQMYGALSMILLTNKS